MEPAPAVIAVSRPVRRGPCSRSLPVEATSWPPRTAVILAADDGSRVPGRRSSVPVPLYRVAGLGLLERSLLTLRAAGIERFRVVVGTEGRAIADRVKGLASLRGLAIEFVETSGFVAGDGVSLSAGAAELDESFLVAMADHVIDTDLVRDFLSRASARPTAPQVAADGAEAVRYLDDACKLRTIDGRIQAIGIDLHAYSSVEAGLYYFPAGTGRRIGELFATGARSISAIATRLAAERPFFAVRVEAGVWQVVKDKAMAREAERRLLRSLAKPSDGFISRHINRPISIAVSRFLARWGVRPNAITTFVFLISLLGAALAATAEPALLAVGGLLFQIASILDGCDGEVARLKFQGSRWGAWYDTLSDNVRYMVFYSALGVAAFKLSGADIYLWALLPFLAFSVFFVVTMGRYVLKTQSHLTNLAITKKVLGGSRKHWWERLVLPLSGLVKQDVQAFAAMVFCLVGMPGPYFWVTMAGSVLMTVSVMRALGREGKAGARAQVFLFYSAGLLLLAWLVSRMPIDSIEVAFRNAGAAVIVAFVAAPLWYAANAFAMSLLLDGRVRFRHLFYNQVVGEAMNTIVPLAGLGGDVFRARHLGEFVGTMAATRAVVQDRFVHALSGPLFAGAAIALTLWLIPLDPAVAAGLTVTAALLLAAGLALLGFVLSPYPSRWSERLLRRLGLAPKPSRAPQMQGAGGSQNRSLVDLNEDLGGTSNAADGARSRFWGRFVAGPTQGALIEPLGRKRMAAVLAAKMAGRLLNLVEITIILRLLHIDATPTLVIAIAGLLTASAVVFFMVPQGLGVNEAGIAGAFTIVGLAPQFGLAFGLIRRARVVTWAGLGVLLQLSVWGWKRLRARVPAGAAAVAEGSS